MSFLSDMVAEDLYRKKEKYRKQTISKATVIGKDGQLILKPVVPNPKKRLNLLKKLVNLNLSNIKISSSRAKHKPNNVRTMSNIYSSKVAGTTFIEGAPEFLRKLKHSLRDTNCILLRLVPERDNKHDPNAVAVEISLKGINKYKKIGYIPREKSRYMKNILENSIYKIVISKVFLTGGIYSYENVGLAFNFYITKR